MKSVFFIPVYNQVHELSVVLEELSSSDLPCDTILLINNGSDDGSEDLIRKSGYAFIDLPENKGVGYSFIQAIKWALPLGYQILGSMAGNGKMLPAEMGRILAPIIENRADYVTGSRFLVGGASPNLPLFRKISIPLLNFFVVRMFFGETVTDATCGYRAMRLELFQHAGFNWEAKWLYKYGFEYYLYAKVIHSSSVRSLEVPITMRYPEKGKRYTKMRPFLDWYDIVRAWMIGRFDGKTFFCSEK